MKSRAPSRRAPFLRAPLLAALLAVAAPACGGGGGGGGGVVQPGLTPSFGASGTAASADGVRLVGGSVSGDEITLHVRVGGPSTSQDLYSFVFDLVLGDTTVASFVPNSETFGTALTLGAGQGSFVEATQQGNRVVVGVTKTSGGPGNGIAAGEPTVVSVRFRLLRAGTCAISFAGSPGPGNPTGDPAALDSTGAVVPSVSFDGAAATLVAN